MPKLSSKSLILPTGSFQELSLLSENLSKAMELYIQPIVQTQEIMENLFRSIIEMQGALRQAFTLPLQQLQESLGYEQEFRKPHQPNQGTRSYGMPYLAAGHGFGP